MFALSFVCVACAAASTIVRSTPEETRLARQHQHDACPGGTWCDCQHKITTDHR